MNKKSVLNAVGFTGKLVVSISVGQVVGKVLGVNIPDATSKIDKVIDVIGCQVISSMVCYAAINFVEAQAKLIIKPFKEGYEIGESFEGREVQSGEEA